MTDDAVRLAALQQLDIGDVWGIGRQYADMLRERGIEYAHQFAELLDD